MIISKGDGKMIKQALLVIDVQNDYFPKGKMELYRSEYALEKIGQLELKFIENDLPIIYIQHIKHQKPADFFEVGTAGAELHKCLKIDEHAIIIE